MVISKNSDATLAGSACAEDVPIDGVEYAPVYAPVPLLVETTGDPPGIPWTVNPDVEGDPAAPVSGFPDGSTGLDAGHILDELSQLKARTLNVLFALSFNT